MNKEIVKERDHRIDSIKGFLILLVVLGHMLEQHISMPSNLAVYLLIYSFHMPLFVMISGYVFKPSQSFNKLWRSSLLLFETFIVFQLIFCFLIWRDNGYSNFDLMNLIRPQKILWYLVSLIIWRIATFMIFKVTNPSGRNQLLVLTWAVTIALFAGFVPFGNEFAFQRTMVFFPLFLTGCLLKANLFTNKLYTNYLKIGGGNSIFYPMHYSMFADRH